MSTTNTLFRFPDARRRRPDVEAWLASRVPTLRPLARRWFDRLRACGDDVRETMHDGNATACVGAGDDSAAFAHVGVFRAHVAVYFFDGASLPDPQRLLEGTGQRGRHVKLRPHDAIDEAALEALIDAAAADVRARLG